MITSMTRSVKLASLLCLCTTLCLSEVQKEGLSGISIPVAGNTWVTNNLSRRSRIIGRTGVENWHQADCNLRTYFRVGQTGAIDIAIRAKVQSGSSKLKFTFVHETREVTLDNTEFAAIRVGTFNITHAGYHYLDMQGISKSSPSFADVTDIIISGPATSGKLYFVKDDFYFGKRGPSVHLNYTIPEPVKEVRYFYSEITVPKGEDVIGSYFMANGFAQGYFGIQVNSATERRVLFSVWSPYRTNNPAEIPANQRITMLKKGQDVHAGKFGGEGSGGQSYRKYMWQAGTPYRFLLKGEPVENNSTEFTAYFFAPEIGQWELMASFRRPKTNTHLTRLHSFLENFIPGTGFRSRRALYANQWVCDVQGNWHELTQARFTADATARKQARLDYAGGAQGNVFFMKNCGFFNETSRIGTVYTRSAAGKKPDIEFSQLP
jgi:hypothetical protein